MNKNLTNSNGEETQRDKIQNPGNRKKAIHPVEPSIRKNVIKKTVIPLVEPSTKKNLKREKEMDQMESWTQKNTDNGKKIHPVEPLQDKSLKREKEIHRMESWTPKETVTFDSLSKPTRQTFPMNNYNEASKTSNVYPNTHNQSNDGEINKVKNPSNTGSALYVIAALLIIAWAIGFFFYNVGSTIHIFLVMALLSILVKIAQIRSY